ncbi:MAG: hypothetical protein A2270_10585 [Elusimicrobia bacterium RIFOXYA12_FULL_51_18]|nr:MAG: hypothetical protein A2270_10585 [Elusimicrobia bacterium RIFOXYA12_FULL_51_18]OGS29489.1 MAG: hypothetical protein A2218_00605 [Elusimicrobia bacterium RIFOXYA2_FULL_53_38]
MKRKGPQKHSNETIQNAITKFEGGARLSAIAREIGVEKSTVKYWLDNAARFMPERKGANPTAARIQTRLTREAWDIIFLALKEIKKKLSDATIRDLVAVMGELFDRQAQFGMLTGRNAVPEQVLEKSEELRITVRKFLHNKSAGEKTASESLGNEAVQRAGAAEATEAETEPGEPKKDANAAT